jgi:hypothetical protein
LQNDSMPFIVGVVGHRDLTQPSREFAADQLKRILVGYRENFPNTPIILTTSLAAGADQLAAQVALQIEGVSLCASIPMDLTTYKETLGSNEDKSIFVDLLAKCEFVVQTDRLELRSGADEDLETKFRENTRFLANHSDLLIAFWDGHISNLVGGTADTVYYKLRKPHRPKSFEDITLNRKEFGSVLVIPIERESEAPHFSKEASFILEPVSLEKQVFNVVKDPIMKEKEGWNRSVNSESSGTDRKSNCSHFSAATERASINLKQKFSRALALILLSGLSVIASIEIQNQLNSRPLAVLSFTVVCVSLIVFQVVRKRKIKDKFHQYSALSDALSIQEFWQNSGIRLEASNYFLTDMNRSNEWMRSFVRTCFYLDTIQKKGAQTLHPSSYVESWINSELDRLSGPMGVIKKNLRIVKFFKFLTSLFIAIALLIWLYVSASLIFELKENVSSVGILQATFVISLATATTFSSYSYLRAFSEQVLRDIRNERIFRTSLENMQVEVEGLSLMSQSQKIAESLGLYLIDDASEWYVRNADREVKTLF